MPSFDSAFAHLPIFVRDLSDSELDEQTYGLLECRSLRAALGDLRSVSVISATEKSVVWSAWSSNLAKWVILKKHFRASTFKKEMLGYLLFRSGPVPLVLHQIPKDGIFVMNQIGKPSCGKKKICIEQAAFAVGSMHAAASCNVRLAAKVDRRLRSQVRAQRYSDQNLGAGLSSSVGFFDLWVTVGDIKIEHFIAGSRQLFVVDLETWSFQYPSRKDLLDLMRNWGAACSVLDVVSAYCAGRRLNLNESERRCWEKALTALVNDY